jgi:phage pi2 protein 07
MFASVFKPVPTLSLKVYKVLLNWALISFLALSGAGFASAGDLTLHLSSASGSSLAGFRVYYKTGSSGAPYNGTGATQGSSPVSIPIGSVNDPNGFDFKLTGLQDGTSYFFAATIYDANGNESPYSNVVSYKTPAAPAAGTVVSYEITASSSSGGTISPAGSTTVYGGEGVAYAIKANANYRIADVKVDGKSIGATSSYTFAKVASDHTISASFAPIKYTVTASAGTGGSISPSGANTVSYGGNLSFTIAPNPGYAIANVSVDGNAKAIASSYTFQNINANHTISVSFAKVSKDVKIWLEAEDSDIGTPMVIADDAGASAGGYVWVPNGNGNFWSPSDDAGRMEVSFQVPDAGDYIIWARVMANSGSDDSFFVAVDGKGPITWAAMHGETWVWDTVGGQSATDDPNASITGAMYLEAGVHTIVFSQREDGTKLDRILVTNDAQYVPEAMGEQTGPTLHRIWLEAENGGIGTPMVIGDDADASDGGYVWVPNGNGNFWSPSDVAGRVEVPFMVPEAGDYTIWARVMANSGSDDSFFVEVDGKGPITWAAMHGETWVWDMVSGQSATDDPNASITGAMYLEAGVHTLVFSQREDGTKLDRILITNDAQYAPGQ